MFADLYTPVGIYLRLRDRFRDTILLESADFHTTENSWSFIGVQAIAGIEISPGLALEYRLPGSPVVRKEPGKPGEMLQAVNGFLQCFEPDGECPIPVAQGLFGYTSYDAVQFFDSIELQPGRTGTEALMRYRLYQYVIAIDHFRDELWICENGLPGLESELAVVESLIRSKDVPVYPFRTRGGESSNCSADDYLAMVRKGIENCHRGDVFQVVLSRRFSQAFTGDEFNVYRALRSINPSPYLFFFDYGDYKLFGSSPESQLIVRNGEATIHPIAGTVRRTGDEALDRQLTGQLLADPKENAEHVMLVDLARNDLSRRTTDVKVTIFKQVHYYSHVIHLVSEVKGRVEAGEKPFDMLAASFPAGTLSGAPKFKAMELIDQYEPTSRGYYGGAIGFVGFNGSFNHAIMIRSFLSRNNTLHYQAGAGIVAKSQPENELEEVNNKLNALKKAILLAETII